MKKIVKLFSFLMSFVAILSLFVSCNNDIQNYQYTKEVIYKAQTKISYSVDGVNNWTNVNDSISINEAGFIAIDMEVVQPEGIIEEKNIECTIIIPSLDDWTLCDCQGGESSCLVDAVNGTTSYTFNLPLENGKSLCKAIFSVIPLGECSTTIKIVYDKCINSEDDANFTINMVK